MSRCGTKYLTVMIRRLDSKKKKKKQGHTLRNMLLDFFLLFEHYTVDLCQLSWLFCYLGT